MQRHADRYRLPGALLEIDRRTIPVLAMSAASRVFMLAETTFVASALVLNPCRRMFLGRLVRGAQRGSNPRQVRRVIQLECRDGGLGFTERLVGSCNDRRLIGRPPRRPRDREGGVEMDVQIRIRAQGRTRGRGTEMMRSRFRCYNPLMPPCAPQDPAMACADHTPEKASVDALRADQPQRCSYRGRRDYGF